jgi:hypothetical protein
MISFDVTKEEGESIDRIVSRVEKALGNVDRAGLVMDILATHANGCPLDFAKLEAFPATDFFHDVGGISRHLNRSTGKLGGCFLPRCAVSQ